MNVTIKTPEEIEKMRIAGKLAADVLEMIAPFVKAGVSTEELDNIMLDYIENTQHAISACLNYHGYPKATCISINEVVCHGIPSIKKLHNGDIVNIDVTVIKDGYHGDTNMMFIVGETTPRNIELINCAQKSLYESIKAIGPGKNLKIIGETIEKVVSKTNFSIVRDFCGHGIGANFHEDPMVLHYKNRIDLELKPGMTFTIEPMINAGTYKCKINQKDGWTVTTADKKPSAQFEHTILITDDGCEVLTLRSNELFDRYIKNS
jgi:methionyl aminopeptidase